MSEKTTLVVTATPNPDEMESVQRYLQGVLPLLSGVGGQLVKRLKMENLIHGKPNGMVLVMDFDSDKAITELFESADYSKLLPVRDKGFLEMNIMLTHTM